MNNEILLVNQVITNKDMLSAMCSYVALHLDDRLRYQFPEETEVVDHMVTSLRDPYFHTNESALYSLLAMAVSEFAATLTVCTITGCENDEHHTFKRELINLIWDARQQTDEWLKGQGIVPGRSAN